MPHLETIDMVAQVKAKNIADFGMQRANVTSTEKLLL